MTEDELAYYRAISNWAAQVDSKPKIISLPIEKGKEYESMCIGLAQGDSFEWVNHLW